MNGRSVGSLHVMRQFQEAKGKDQLWAVSGPQGDDWQQAIIYIGIEFIYRLSIESHRGKSAFLL